MKLRMSNRTISILTSALVMLHMTALSSVTSFADENEAADVTAFSDELKPNSDFRLTDYSFDEFLAMSDDEMFELSDEMKEDYDQSLLYSNMIPQIHFKLLDSSMYSEDISAQSKALFAELKISDEVIRVINIDRSEFDFAVVPADKIYNGYTPDIVSAKLIIYLKYSPLIDYVFAEYPGAVFEATQSDITANTSLWDNFLRYDLCITNYNALSDEEKELCHFIFDTEQAAGDNIICERARRTLTGDNDLGERITLDNLENTYGIWDKYYSNSIYGWQIYTHCVPDVIHLGSDGEPAPFWYEYWLDDTGSEYVVFNEKTSPDNYRNFDVYENGELLETITAADSEMPFKDIRNDEELMKGKGLIQQDGGWYYTKQDGTAVFVWCGYADTVQVMPQMYDIDAAPIEEPFVVADEINGCPVTAIESGAFRMSPVTKVVLPDTIEYIGMSAFFNCTYLNQIELGQ